MEPLNNPLQSWAELIAGVWETLSHQTVPRWGYFVLILPLSGHFAPVSPDLGAPTQGHAAKYCSALIKLANPSSVISRCVFLASPR